MARISLQVMTHELTNNSPALGSWELEVKAGLDESPEAILQEALERVRASIQALPPDKRYSRYKEPLSHL